MSFTQLEKRMIAHGAAVTFIGMLAGLGLLLSLLGGIELIPGTITPLAIPGPTDAWVRAHVGGILNGILTIVVAIVMSGVGVVDAAARRVYWMIVGSAWAFTVFYWAALFAPNRALSIADNRWGPSNLAAIIGFVPALAFTVFDLIGVYLLMRAAFRSARE
jgi:hypothetical protein